MNVILRTYETFLFSVVRLSSLILKSSKALNPSEKFNLNTPPSDTVFDASIMIGSLVSFFGFQSVKLDLALLN